MPTEFEKIVSGNPPNAVYFPMEIGTTFDSDYISFNHSMFGLDVTFTETGIYRLFCTVPYELGDTGGNPIYGYTYFRISAGSGRATAPIEAGTQLLEYPPSFYQEIVTISELVNVRQDILNVPITMDFQKKNSSGIPYGYRRINPTPQNPYILSIKKV